MKPLIFITNDDGVAAKGLKYAIKAASKFGRVVCVTPEYAQSGMSHAITMHAPLFVREVEKSEDVEIYALTGTPVDCVKMAFDHLMKGEKPVLTISGINHGSNSAINVLYSGTMGAAIEASFYGIPSIGLSLLDHDPDADFTQCEEFVERIIKTVLDKNIEGQYCLNVNIPNVKKEEIKGIKVCRQNAGFWREEFVPSRDPRGREYFWLTGDFDNAEPEATDTDNSYLDSNYISIVPIQVDLTDYLMVDAMQGWDF